MRVPAQIDRLHQRGNLVRRPAMAPLSSGLSDLVGGAHAARREWSTSIVSGDFTVLERDRQTSSLRVALLDVVNARRISFQYRDLIGGRVLDPIARAFAVRLRQHHVTLSN